ncbi:hypothetical protein CN318_29745 [Bacillus cereus]|nr:hypothetical protein CN318_29745 [Bacillus cereus]PFQ61205.1 hypothetical protein COK21_27770 [Bacillus cereus]
MPFESNLQEEIIKYVYGHLPNEEWYEKKFYPFITNNELRTRLITEFKNSRVIYKIFEGLQATDELLLAQVKTQVIMYVSIQEAAINYVLFDLKKDTEIVKKLLYQNRLIKISIPQHKRDKLEKELFHDGKELIPHYEDKKPVDKTKIRYDQKVDACYNLGLIDSDMKNDLIKLYEYRNTVHLEAELKKGLTYDLEMGLLAYRRVEGLSIRLSEHLTN